MTQIVNISQASKLTGLSAYALRKGTKTARFPTFRTGEKGKILFDLQLLAQAIASEMLSSVKK